jgi:phage-related protein
MVFVKPCIFVGSSKKAISAMPKDVKAAFGVALYLAQTGVEADNVKALRGFGGRGVLEVIEDHDGDTYRAVYTIRFSTAVYVLHAFQKKSKSGIATPKHELDLIASRLRDAEALHRHLATQEK